jgi:hypothetical protein
MLRLISKLAGVIVTSALLIGSFGAVATAQTLDRNDGIVAGDRDRGFDLGWLGLIGLAGLAGLKGREKTSTKFPSTSTARPA